MGQCASRKSTGAYAYSTPQSRPMAAPNMKFRRNKHDENQNQDDNKEHSRRPFSRGVATSFGFKRITPSGIPIPKDITPINKNTPQQFIDNNGNDDPLDTLDTTELHPSGRSTPRLAPPKKEASTTRLNRFGFRNQANLNRNARVPGHLSNAENKNNNMEKDKMKKTVSIAPVVKSKVSSVKATTMTNKAKPAKSSLPAKLTFHTTQLPRPQVPLRFAESKTAKTAANINRKVSSASARSEEAFSSKEGSVTEDSGIGSHTSGTNSHFTGDSDPLNAIELMDGSPTFGARRNNKNLRARNLELIVSGKNFDVRDLDDTNEDGVVTEVAVIPLPRLPSVFANNSTDSRSTSSSVFGNVSTGMVRERTLEFERKIDKNRRKISVTSSEGFSEDYGEEEKSFRERSCTEKIGQGVNRLFSSSRSFKEPFNTRKPLHSDKDSSPASSEDQDWEQGGEGMADVCSSIGFSSSDESRDKEISPLMLRNTGMSRSSYADPLTNTGAIPKDNSRSVLLNKDDHLTLGDSVVRLSNKNIPIETNSYQKRKFICDDAGKESVSLRSVLLTIEDSKQSTYKESDNLTQSCTKSMMTSSTSMSSCTSSGISRPDYLKSSFIKEDYSSRPILSKNYSSDLISPILTNSILSGSSGGNTPREQLRSVLLSLEDPKFAAVAAASSSGTLLDDETSPVDSLISSYTESEEIIAKNKAKSSKSSTESKDINEKSPASPASPGTPTNASLSLSEGRDFLIDDEIADQPALIFNDTVSSVHSVDRMRNESHHNISLFSESGDRSSDHQNISDNITLVDNTPKLARKVLRSCEGSPALARAKNVLLSRTGSVDTLSPCESIASDDLMMDFDHSQSSGIDDSTDRLHMNGNNGMHSLNELTLISDFEGQEGNITKQWTSLMGTTGSHSNKDSPPYSVVRTNNYLRSRTNTPQSVPDSPRSVDRSGLRASPLLRSARTTHGSPSHYDSDESLRISQSSMASDIVGIKTMLLKLKRVLQETDEDNLLRNEPLNPFETQNSLKNGLYNGLGNEPQSDVESLDSMDLNSCPSLEMAELRRQIEFLQSQLEDKDRTVHQLQHQIAKYNFDKREDKEREHETCNAATQTDRVRPLSAGPSLLQNLPTNEGGMGPLVSVNEQSRRSRPQSMLDTHPLSSSPSRTPPLKLWRKPGEPPPPTSRYTNQTGSSLPRRTRSRSRPTGLANSTN